MSSGWFRIIYDHDINFISKMVLKTIKSIKYRFKKLIDVAKIPDLKRHTIVDSDIRILCFRYFYRVTMILDDCKWFCVIQLISWIKKNQKGSKRIIHELKNIHPHQKNCRSLSDHQNPQGHY